MTFITVIIWKDQNLVEPPKNEELWITDLEDDIFDAIWTGTRWIVEGFGYHDASMFKNMFWSYRTGPRLMPNPPITQNSVDNGSQPNFPKPWDYTDAPQYMDVDQEMRRHYIEGNWDEYLKHKRKADTGDEE